MYLIQILLPVRDNRGQPFPHAFYEDVRQEMTRRFGGVTAYLRSPAEGAFEGMGGEVMRDDIVIVEVMCEALDRPWWSAYRASLTELFEQQELVVRALPYEQL
jgi:hypothetical protein